MICTGMRFTLICVAFILFQSTTALLPLGCFSLRHHEVMSRFPLSTVMSSSSQEQFEALNPDDDEEEEVEPGKMRVSEIKAELDLRELDYSDCFDKESLVERLHEARATGKASPKIIDKFNRQKIEQTFNEEKMELNDNDILSATANDGTLPGGMTPDQFKKLMGNPEIMTLLQSPKMQTLMQIMMTGGREEVEQKLKEDPELQETMQKLNSIMGM